MAKPGKLFLTLSELAKVVSGSPLRNVKKLSFILKRKWLESEGNGRGKKLYLPETAAGSVA